MYYTIAVYKWNFTANNKSLYCQTIEQTLVNHHKTSKHHGDDVRTARQPSSACTDSLSVIFEGRNSATINQTTTTAQSDTLQVSRLGKAQSIYLYKRMPDVESREETRGSSRL